MLSLEFLPDSFTVCKIEADEKVDTTAPFLFYAHTDAECSLVCPAAHVPAKTLAREDGWCCLRVAGAMEFSLVGVLAGLSAVLAAAEVPIFAVSTYDTDYILFKQEQRAKARVALLAAGYTLT